jgi:hypothetical protein
MLRHKDDEVPEQHVRPWLEKNGFPLENYWKLSTYYKRLLHDQVCRCTRSSPSSDMELRNLYQRLRSGERRGSISSPNAVDVMTHRDLQELFSPLSSSETVADLYKY